jgi:hypothetical protein
VTFETTLEVGRSMSERAPNSTNRVQ